MKTLTGSEKRDACLQKLKEYNMASGLDEQFAGLFARLTVSITESGLGYVPDTNITASRNVNPKNGLYKKGADIKISINGDSFEWSVEETE